MIVICSESYRCCRRMCGHSDEHNKDERCIDNRFCYFIGCKIRCSTKEIDKKDKK